MKPLPSNISMSAKRLKSAFPFMNAWEVHLQTGSKGLQLTLLTGSATPPSIESAWEASQQLLSKNPDFVEVDSPFHP